MLLRNCDECSTNILKVLDKQLIAEMLAIEPDAFVDISNIDGVILADDAAHPYLIPAAAAALQKAIVSAGKSMTINSAYRTLPQQALLYLNQKRCGIVAAAPGASNHQGFLAIDIEDPYFWQPFLAVHGWRKLGDWDRMHYDFKGRDLRPLSIEAFQRLAARNGFTISIDGSMGESTLWTLRNAPIEGYQHAAYPRVLRLTDPIQRGQDVGKLQLKLGIKADGIFGAGTATAVAQWQIAQGLAGDGVVGAASRERLELVA
ncbi:peptidoglycan-binding protein [Chamaesiphon sp. OTE_75_metabat_556]|uniref:peptidoglycan-binding protein n=1 Tax=Chamaesiphon sp. OTE_75_metabat_556 TaxID=2964692 RepID=UPI00286CB0D7|nr:peptidoglycan-binding protein [Chamaesiphon sp. OTE_75_metabat_556]